VQQRPLFTASRLLSIYYSSQPPSLPISSTTMATNTPHIRSDLYPPPELWNITLGNLRDRKRQTDLTYLWTVVRHVSTLFKKEVENSSWKSIYLRRGFTSNRVSCVIYLRLESFSSFHISPALCHISLHQHKQYSIPFEGADCNSELFDLTKRVLPTYCLSLINLLSL